jgi:hypothetical protein
MPPSEPMGGHGFRKDPLYVHIYQIHTIEVNVYWCPRGPLSSSVQIEKKSLCHFENIRKNLIVNVSNALGPMS